MGAGQAVLPHPLSCGARQPLDVCHVCLLQLHGAQSLLQEHRHQLPGVHRQHLPSPSTQCSITAWAALNKLLAAVEHVADQNLLGTLHLACADIRHAQHCCQSCQMVCGPAGHLKWVPPVHLQLWGRQRRLQQGHRREGPVADLLGRPAGLAGGLLQRHGPCLVRQVSFLPDDDPSLPPSCST